MRLTKKSEDISGWYNDVVVAAKLADYSPVKGCMVIRPNGYGIWENVQTIFNGMIKKRGVRNAYFPTFIPMHFLEKEKEHVEGFAPELAVVTQAGGEKLQEPLAIRPTSETIMYAQFAEWIQSYRDLPLKINQWANAVRWEKRTYLFLRTSEFLWQEGHTAHATHEEADKEVQAALKDYIDIYQNYFGIYGIAGVKSELEKFAGAEKTYTYEMLMPDGKALQGATSHDLGQHFSKVFEIQFLDNAGERNFVWQTSWGLSTRSIGALILAHGDDKGLVTPPLLAPNQVVIVPIFSNNKETDQIIDRQAREITTSLGQFYSAILDDDTEHSIGFKFNEYELQGIPIRIELGKKELEEQSVMVYRRDADTKELVKIANLEDYLAKLLIAMQETLLNKSKQFTTDNTHYLTSYDDFKKIMASTRGFIYAFWCEDPNCERKIKAETKATTRCLPLDAKEEAGQCIYCGKPAKHQWLFAQSY